MARRYRIVIDDAVKAHVAYRESYVRGFKLGGAPAIIAQQLADKHVGTPRPVGTVHTEAERDCPFGRPNCEHCGDPAYRAACRMAEHCAQCGTDHGIAPRSVLVKNGYRLEEIG